MSKPSAELLRRAREHAKRKNIRQDLTEALYFSMRDMLEFAEQIVRECAEIANSERRVWNADAPAPQQRISAEILRKFGVEP